MAKSKNPVGLLQRWLASGEPPHPSDDVEAEALVRAAADNGVAGLLRAATGDNWPPPVRAELARAQREALVHGVWRLDLACRALRLLEARGLRALPLKGAALAELLYDSVADRPMADVDLLALEGNDDSAAALRAAGFVELVRDADHATSFVDPVTGSVLELHGSLTSCPGLFPLDREGLWFRRQDGPGQVPHLPSAEDLLVQLALHAAFQHGLVLSLVQWLDFRRLFERRPPDPGRVLALAAESRAEAVLAAALAAAQAVVGAPVPPALALALRPLLPGALARRIADPLSLVGPIAPGLARVRWELLCGRRWELLTRTLRGRRSGESALRRAGRLVGRFVFAPRAGSA